jgi:hypothetical protein
VQPAGFLCPECSAPLRLNDRSQIGREIECPACGKRLRIVADAGEVRAVRAAEPAALELPRHPGSRGTLRVIWLATACLGGAILWIVTRPTALETRVESTTFEQDSPAAPVVVAEPIVEAPEIESPAPVPAPVVEPPAAPALPPPEPPVLGADDRPLMPELAPDLREIDVAGQLALPIEEFSQMRPVQVRLLLRQIAELSAVPIDLSEVETEPWRTKLDEPATVELRQTTIREVLEEIVRRAELSYRHRDGVIFVTPPNRPES